MQRVLVVDDDAISRHLLKNALAQASLPAELLSSGDEALAWLDHNTPRLVLLDLVMPPPDGYAVLRAIRGNSRLEDVPVVVLTALDADDEVARAFDLGADDFVRKPFRTTELVARIRSQLRLREYVIALARRERDSKVVLELTQALSSTLDFRNILFTVVRRIAEVARVDRCSIVLSQDGTNVGYVVAASDDRDLRDLPISLARYPEIREVMHTGLPLVIDDAATHPLFDVVRDELPSQLFRSLALLPILFEDRPMGVLFLRSRLPAAPREHELSLARTVANATAIALRNARILQNLRDQTQANQSAREQAERRLGALQVYSDFFHASAEGIAAVDPDGTILFSNARAHEIIGKSGDEISGLRIGDFIHERDEGIVEEIRARFARGETIEPTDIRIWRDPDGKREIRILSVSFSSVHQEERDTLLVSFRDVTSERATASELQQTKEFLQRVIDSSVDAIISADLHGNVLLFNTAAERCYGYEAPEVVGHLNVRQLYPRDEARRIMRLIRGLSYGGEGRLEGYRTDVLAKDGARIPVQLSAALIYEDGRPVGSVGIFTDLRERLHMEARLTEAQEGLREREKLAVIAELAGATAHELNQPLTSILGYAQMLRQRVDAEDGKRTIDIIASQAERMAEIVRKIGKITKYETKTYVGAAKIIDLDRSIEEDDEAVAR